jgi:hypothetical protein
MPKGEPQLEALAMMTTAQLVATAPVYRFSATLDRKATTTEIRRTVGIS